MNNDKEIIEVVRKLSKLMKKIEMLLERIVRLL